jgi:uncharacterized protein
VSQENVEMLRSFYEAFNRGDIDAALAGAPPDFEIHDALERPDAGIHRGREAARKAIESISEPFDDLQVEPREFIEAGDEIVVIFHARGRGKGSGIPLDVELAHVFTMQDGHMQVMRAYTSKASALEALGLSEHDAHADS